MLQLPEELALLNMELPPATYARGRGVVDRLLQRSALLEPAWEGSTAALRPGQPSPLWDEEERQRESAPAPAALKQPHQPPLHTSSISITALAGLGGPAPPAAAARTAAPGASPSRRAAVATALRPLPAGVLAGASSPMALPARAPPSPPPLSPSQRQRLERQMAHSPTAALLATSPFVAALGAAFAPELAPRAPEEPSLLIERPGSTPVRLHPK